MKSERTLFIVGGYEITYSPKYLKTKDLEDPIIFSQENQNGIWDAIIFFIGEMDFIEAVEFRYVLRKESRSIVPYLFFLSNKNEDIEDKIKRNFEGLLPSLYGWNYLNKEKAIKESTCNYEKGWKAAVASRRIHFFDIPSSLSLRLVGNNSKSASVENPSGTTSEPNPNRNSNTARYLPNQMDSIGMKNYCVPFYNEINGSSFFSEHIFSEMLRREEAVLRFFLIAQDGKSFHQHRRTASVFSRFIAPFVSYFNDASNNSPQHLSNFYNRFWLPPGQNIRMQIYGFGSTDGDALGILQSVLYPFGGLSTFQIENFDIVNSYKNMPSINPVLYEAKSDDSSEDVILKIEEERLKKIDVNLPHNNQIKKQYIKFLHETPYYYSFKELACILNLPFTYKNGLPGLETKPVVPFSDSTHGFYPYNHSPSSCEVRIGLSSGNLELEISKNNWHIIPVDELAKHTFVTGSTGSGKSTFMKFLLAEMIRIDLPFMVVEPVKGEYYDSLKEIKLCFIKPIEILRINLSGNGKGGPSDEFFAFDPMIIPDKTSVASHISYLKSVFQCAFPMDDVISLLFENGIYSYYLEYLRFSSFNYGSNLNFILHDISSEIRKGMTYKECFDFHKLYFGIKREESIKVVHPSFEGFINYFIEVFLENEFPSGKKQDNLAAEWRQIFKRRFYNLIKGPLGFSFQKFSEFVIEKDVNNCGSVCMSSVDVVKNYLNKYVVVELESISDNEQKALVMAFILTFFFEVRQGDGNFGGDERHSGRKIKHLLVIEEAHRLLANSNDNSKKNDRSGESATSKTVKMFSNMLAEIRSYGQGLVVIDQIPSKIDSDVLKNTNLKVMLRLNSAEDRRYLGGAMGLDLNQEEFVSLLTPPQAVVFNAKVNQPVLLEIPFHEMIDGISSWKKDGYFTV